MSSIPGRHQVIPVGTAAAEATAPSRASVVIGFGSPADESGVTRLDLNDILLKHPLATFMMRAAGAAMHDAGISDGDLLIVDRAITPASGHVVVAFVADEFYCRRLVIDQGQHRLVASDPEAPEIAPTEADQFLVWGVVTHSIKAMPV